MLPMVTQPKAVKAELNPVPVAEASDFPTMT